MIIFLSKTEDSTSFKAVLTHKENLKHSRHSWLRLTPAYSVKLVRALLEMADKPNSVLDPFSGTGTTGILCAKESIPATMVDINPFLVWLIRAKSRTIDAKQADRVLTEGAELAKRAYADRNSPHWVPKMHRVDRWWTGERLQMLSALFSEVMKTTSLDADGVDLLKVAFCQVMKKYSSAVHNHQSMSFKEHESVLFPEDEAGQIVRDFRDAIRGITEQAREPLSTEPVVVQDDARTLGRLRGLRFDCIMTSPPYANRMSYIRELRPYMYWLGYLKTPSDASDLDWEAIGGTWGTATSKLMAWKPGEGVVPFDGFGNILGAIEKHSVLLSKYVQKYFNDMMSHFQALRSCLSENAQLYYVVGNSKFYDVMVPTEAILSAILLDCGYEKVGYSIIRKRSSKKELFEYLLQASY